MRQAIVLGITLTTAFLLCAAPTARAMSDGAWGPALGTLLVGPLSVFVLTHAVVYFASGGLLAKSKVASFTQSRLNYVAALVAVLGVLGSASGGAV